MLPAEQLQARIVALLRIRYPGCPLDVHTANLSEWGPAKVGAHIRWAWHVWVHGLPLRIVSWATVDECAGAYCSLKIEGDNGGTPGHAELAPQVQIVARSRTVCRSRSRR